MNKTAIEWADFTLNPVTGCTPVSEGCENCYAARIAGRFWKGRKFSEVQFHPERLAEVEKFPTGALVFLGSMTDMALAWPEWLWEIHDIIDDREEVNFVMLTKRPEKLPYMQAHGLKNLMIGVSVENAAHLDRIDILRRNYAGPKCVSFEPLLGPVDSAVLDGIDWVIAGQETGPGARPAEHIWFHTLENSCMAEGIPYFEKKVPSGDPRRQWPANFRALKALQGVTGKVDPIQPPIVIEIPIKIHSEPNVHKHWSKTCGRKKEQRETASLLLRCELNRRGLKIERGTVRLTRLAPRLLDTDNLAGAFKAIRDGIADALGIDDRDERIKYEYHQEKSKEYGMRLALLLAK